MGAPMTMRSAGRLRANWRMCVAGSPTRTAAPTRLYDESTSARLLRSRSIRTSRSIDPTSSASAAGSAGTTCTALSSASCARAMAMANGSDELVPFKSSGATTSWSGSRFSVFMGARRRLSRCKSSQTDDAGALVRVPDELHLALDPHFVCHQHTAGLEHLVPPESPLPAVNLRPKTETSPCLSPRVRASALIFAIQHQFQRAVVNSQISNHPKAIALPLGRFPFDPSAAEGDARKPLRIEEIRAAQVRV